MINKLRNFFIQNFLWLVFVGLIITIQGAFGWTNPSQNPPGGTGVITTLSNGNVGVGTTNPQNKLDVEGKAAIGASYSGSNAAPTNGLLVEGNVGIGTVNPGAKLEVAGSVKILDGTQGSGKVLTSDAAGLATWQTPVSPSGIPSGGIIMWSGTLATIPSGWALCDGTNGTPDLRDRFIYGVSTGQNPGTIGGASSHSHTENAHTHSVQLWAQYYWGNVASPKWHPNSGPTVTPQLGRVQGSAPLAYDNAGNPQWTQNAINSTLGGGYGVSPQYEDMLGINGNTVSGGPGSTDSASNLPPYYKIAFIMKL